jgi:type VI secretion system protein VasG
MVVKDIRSILEKLNPHCMKTLESAVGGCVSRSHYELTWEHLLLEFLDSSDNDIACILAHSGVDTGRLKKAIGADLEALATGNGGKPTFSPQIVASLEQAWNLASLYYNLPAISSGVLFTTAMEETKRSLAGYAAELRHIDHEKLKLELLSVIARSAEQRGAASTTPAGQGSPEVLEQFCTNFTRQARDGKIDFISGRDEEIRQVLDILSRRRKNNPILVGEAGVGKTAVVEGLALRIVAGDVPDTLKNVELWGLDLGLLQAGASVKGEFEKRLKNVIETVKQSAGAIILFIDEAHTLIGAGGAAGQGDAANLLKPALARGELRTLAATTWAEYRKYFEKDPALARRFQLVKVEEPDEAKACTMLHGIAASYEKHHGVHITDAGIKAAVALSHRYISGRQLPDKAVDVLDTAATRVKMSQTTTPASLDRSRRLKADTERALASLQKDRKAGIAVSDEAVASCEKTIAATEEQIKTLSDKWEMEKCAVAEIVGLQNQLGGLDEQGEQGAAQRTALLEEIQKKTADLKALQGESPMVFPNVSAEICAQVIGDWTGIPIGSMLKDEAAALLEIEQRLEARVVGQSDAIAELANCVRSAKSGMGNPDAPLGVFLFTGPSGVGKTECAMTLADTLFGGEKFLTVINMSEYQEKHTVSQLKGSPPGYVGYGEGGILTEAVRQKPYSIVLLDEVEKAHREVLNLFYQVFDKGFMRDGEGREINFRNTLIIMTSNLGSDTIIDLCGGEQPPEYAALKDAVRPELTAHFQPALLGRIRVLPFRPLDGAALAGIVGLKLDKIAKRIRKTYGIDFAYSSDFVNAIAGNCTTVEAGARNIDSLIDQVLLPQISRQLLAQLGEQGRPGCQQIRVELGEDGGFAVSFE